MKARLPGWSSPTRWTPSSRKAVPYEVLLDALLITTVSAPKQSLSCRKSASMKLVMNSGR